MWENCHDYDPEVEEIIQTYCNKMFEEKEVCKFTSEISVRLIQKMGGDHMVVAAARVSTSGEEAIKLARVACPIHTPEMPEYETCDLCYPYQERIKEHYGLIRYLMKHRHGCYDAKTDVLTSEGWKNWTDVKGNELFCTVDPETDQIQYQQATGLYLGVDYEGEMYHVSGSGVDLLVTPGHRMYACFMTTKEGRKKEDFSLVPIEALHGKNHCYKKDATWEKEDDSRLTFEELQFVGFAIGDGYVKHKQVSFHLRRKRKIRFLYNICEDLGYSITKDGDWYKVIWPFNFEIYNQAKEKIIPQWILLEHSAEDLEGLYQGLMQADGTYDRTHASYDTTSETLSGQFQQLCLHIGIAANISQAECYKIRKGSFGTKPIYRTSIVGRNLRPEVNRCNAYKGKTERIPYWKGKIYCVKVPNGTLYVRRNGKPVWSGNTPFEHSALTFFVHAPMFVWWEWVRHRIGFSYNLESSRYKKLDPVFWIPNLDRPITPAEDHKPARPKFKTDGTLCNDAQTAIRTGCKAAWKLYDEMVENGIATEVARAVLPSSVYFSGWVTCNPRSLMSFLSLRIKDDRSLFKSYPQIEIEEAARVCENILREGWPLTYEAFVECGRVAP